MPEARPRIFVVEDHPLMRKGIEGVLRERYDLVGSASDAQGAIELIPERDPDLVLLDVRFDGGGGSAVVDALNQQGYRTKYLAYSVSTSANDVIRMFRVGVDGYVVKTADEFELVDQIDNALSGGRPVSREVAGYLEQIDDMAASNAEIESLTPKERQVVTLIARGYRNIEVADELEISIKTVETHMKHIFDKLGAASRHEVIRIAFETGFVDPDRRDEDQGPEGP